mmetsp:Transcript_4918/g.6370  ORF Transcript_4918/g.6370 Transcript_4918/m.6370 type:complete len:809 (-) Transcript_4918:85-2511(-)
MALSAGSVGGALNGVAGAGGMGMQPFQQQANFTPPLGETPREPTSRSPNHGGGIDIPGQKGSKGSLEEDKTCMSFEFDGDQIITSYCEASGDRAKILVNNNDGDRMFAGVGVSVTAAGLLTQWVDKRSPSERSAGLPVGVVVGSLAKSSDQIMTGFKKLLGNKLETSVAQGRRHKLKLKSRKLHAQRARLGILGYDSDDEIDETDGGERVYPGSKLCIEINANTRAGTMHVLPEECLALCLVEMKQRVASKLFGSKTKDKYYEARNATMVVPCCWADSERTAALTAASLIDVDLTLMSSGLATLAGALFENSAISSYVLVGTGGEKKGGLKVTDHIKSSLAKVSEPDEGDEEDDDFEGSLVLVITGGLDSLEASLLYIEKAPDSDADTRKLGWVHSLQVVCGRGVAHENAGLDHVIASLDGKDQETLLRSVSTYNSNNVISTSGAKNEQLKGKLSSAMESCMNQLFKCIDRCLSTSRAEDKVIACKNKIGTCLVRGSFFGSLGSLALDQLQDYLSTKKCFDSTSRMFMLPQDCAARGASLLSSRDTILPNPCFNEDFLVLESLQLAIGLVHSPASSKDKRSSWSQDETDFTFSRDINIPYTGSLHIDSNFLKKCGGGTGLLRNNIVHFTVCEQEVKDEDKPDDYCFKRLQPLGDPLSRINPKTLESERGVSVFLKFEVDESGLLSIHKEAFVSEKEDDLIKHNEKSFFMKYLSRIIMFLVILATFGGFGYSTYQQHRETSKIELGRHLARRDALVNFYQTVNPEMKSDTIDRALEEHKGKETVLWKKLEKKYGKAPSRPDYLKYRREL